MGLATECKQKNIYTPEIEISVGYDDYKYPFAANPYVAVCLDSADNPISYEYYVYYGNIQSPNGEIKFIRESADEEKIAIQLESIPQNVHQIIILVANLDWYPANLIVRASSRHGYNISELVLNYHDTKENKMFSIAKLIRNNYWSLYMALEKLTESESNKLFN